MVLSTRNIDMEDSMPQTVPSAGYTPPCDYSNFADNFDLSLLPGGDLPLSPTTTLYTQSPPPSVSCGDKTPQPKIYTTFYPSSPQSDIDLGPDFQKLLVPQQPEKKNTNLYPNSPIYLEVPSSKNYHANSPTGALSPYSPQSLLSPNEPYGVYQTPPGSDHQSPYPNSPDVSFYSPNDYLQSQYIKKETIYPPSPNHNYSNYEIKQESYLSPCRLVSSPNPDVLDLLDSTPLGKQIKQESTVDFGNILQNFPDLLEEAQKNKNPQTVPEKPKDHQLLREVLRDTSFQRKYNIKPFDFCIMSDVKSEEEGEEGAERALITQEQLARENIEPVLNLAIEQMRKDVDTTCAALGISPDPSQWTSANVLSWLQWTSRQFGLPPPAPDQWDVTGSNLVALSEEEFTRRAPQGGVILHAQLEIWKAAYSEEDLGMQWLPESASSNASSGDISDEDEEEAPIQADPTKPSTSRSTGGSHIHLWQFLKELLASPQIHGSCIRWLDRSKGVFKIEDSVKVARLWGKRKNRPAMNYDKLSRSIRQYYKKGIMKKTERSQRLVYQFCHPYNL